MSFIKPLEERARASVSTTGEATKGLISFTVVENIKGMCMASRSSNGGSRYPVGPWE